MRSHKKLLRLIWWSRGNNSTNLIPTTSIQGWTEWWSSNTFFLKDHIIIFFILTWFPFKCFGLATIFYTFSRCFNLYYEWGWQRIIFGWTQEFRLSIWSHTQKSGHAIIIWKLMIIYLIFFLLLHSYVCDQIKSINS